MPTNKLTIGVVCRAIELAEEAGLRHFVLNMLADQTGESIKNCVMKITEASESGLVELDRAKRAYILTPAGKELRKHSHRIKQ